MIIVKSFPKLRAEVLISVADSRFQAYKISLISVSTIITTIYAKNVHCYTLVR